MTLLRTAELAPRAPRRVYRSAEWMSPAIIAVVMALITAFVALPKREPTPAPFVAVPAFATVMFTAWALRLARRAARPGNWRVIQAEEGLYIHLRAPAHLGLPEEGPTVVFLPAEEIAAVGRAVESRTVPTRRGRMTYRTAYVDVYLRHDRMDALRAALRDERRRLPARRTVEVPVRAIDPPGVRIAWEWIRPPERGALALLQAQYPAAPLRKDDADWEALDRPGRLALIDAVWEAGQAEEAHRLARTELGLDSRAAWAYLDEHCAQGRGARPED